MAPSDRPQSGPSSAENAEGGTRGAPKGLHRLRHSTSDAISHGDPLRTTLEVSKSPPQARERLRTVASDLRPRSVRREGLWRRRASIAKEGLNELLLSRACHVAAEGGDG